MYHKIYSKTYMNDFIYSYEKGHTKEVDFRRCSAQVGVTNDGEFTYLRSYRTIVCFIDNLTGEAFDVLRTVYGYTATSAQHISKFLHDYEPVAVFRTNFDQNGEYYLRIK